MAKRRPNTKNRGAADVRDQILDKIARMKSDRKTLWFTASNGDHIALIGADELAAWIRSMAPRAGKKKGGMGKR